GAQDNPTTTERYTRTNTMTASHTRMVSPAIRRVEGRKDGALRAADVPAAGSDMGAHRRRLRPGLRHIAGLAICRTPPSGILKSVHHKPFCALCDECKPAPLGGIEPRLQRGETAQDRHRQRCA